jgi:hypothetical protein
LPCSSAITLGVGDGSGFEAVWGEGCIPSIIGLKTNPAQTKITSNPDPTNAPLDQPF